MTPDTAPSASWPRLAAFSRWLHSPRKQLAARREAKRQAAEQARALIDANDPAGLREAISPWIGALDSPSSPQETLLGMAARLGRSECAQTLLNHGGYRFESRDYWNLTALERAAEHGQAEFIGWALDRGARVALPNEPRAPSAFSLAAGAGSAQSLRLLAQRSENPARGQAISFLHLAQLSDEPGPQGALIHLLGDPLWRQSLPQAEALCQSVRQSSLLRQSSQHGSAGEPATRRLLECFLDAGFGAGRPIEALQDALAGACCARPENRSQPLVEALWAALPEGLHERSGRAMLQSATEANNPELLHWLLRRLPEPSPREAFELSFSAMRNAGFETGSLWLSRAGALLPSDWRALILEASDRSNLEALAALDAAGAPFEAPLFDGEPLAELLARDPNSPALPWLLERLGLSDRPRLARLREMAILHGEDFAGAVSAATAASLATIERLDQRAQLAEAAAPALDLKRAAPRL